MAWIQIPRMYPYYISRYFKHIHSLIIVLQQSIFNNQKLFNFSSAFISRTLETLARICREINGLKRM